MKCVNEFIVLVTLSALMNVFAADPQEEREADVRAGLNYSGWPNKNGFLKKGLKFVPGNYPSLSGYEIVSDSPKVFDQPPTLYRQIRLTKGQSVIILSIAVAQARTGDSHDWIVNDLALTNVPVDNEHFSSASTLGLDIGDFSFIHTGSTLSNLPYIGFCRNNVCLTIRADGESEIYTLAKALDSQILALPDLTPAQFDALRPVISEFRPVDPVRAREYNQKITSMVISVYDPAEEKVKEIVDDLGGRLDVIENTLPVQVQVTDRSGPALPLELIAINDSLQFSTARSSIAVLPFDLDTTPPVLVLPANIVAECNGCAGTLVNYPPATATDDQTANPVITYSQASGTRFPLGITTIRVEARDEAGNLATGSFTVSIKDSTPPTLTLTSETAKLWPPDHTFATVTLSGTISDTCDCGPFTPGALSGTVLVVDSGKGEGGEKKEPDFRNFTLTSLDAQGKFTATVELRKERSGSGDGRTYKISVSAMDKAGNSGTSGIVEVKVPKDNAPAK